MMKADRIHEIISGIDPALVEEADGAGLEHKKRMPRLARAGLIAACLCLALVGTAVAAMSNVWFKVTDVKFYPTTHVNGALSSLGEVRYTYDRDYIPWDQFSQEAHEVVRSSTYLPQYRGFDSWDAAEEFLGVEVANNPILDQWEPLSWSLTDTQYGIKMDENKCYVTFSGLMDAPGISLGMAYNQNNGNGRLHLNVHAGIDTAPWETPEGTGIGFHNCQEPVTETYVTPSGLQALITYARQLDDDDCINCHAIFQMHGFSLGLSALQEGDADQLVPLIKEILDAYS